MSAAVVKEYLERFGLVDRVITFDQSSATVAEAAADLGCEEARIAKTMAFQVARHHHEKWNGKGYPDGLSGENIPLCARIMAVADVFDAVSAKRCYRDAMPLEECYRIITGGRGSDLDPDIVDAFMLNTDAVEKIYHSKIHFD